MKKVFLVVLLVLTGSFEIVLPGNASASAMLNVIHDAFVLDANTIWGEIPEELEFGYHEPRAGTVNAHTLSGSLLSVVSKTYTAFSSTNVAGVVTGISSTIGEDSLFVNLHSNLEIGPAVGMVEYGYSKSAWNLVFEIVGDGVTFTNFYSSSTGVWWDYNETELYDVTSGLFYDGYITNINLMSGHTYELHAESVQRGGGRTGSSDLGLRFGNVHLKVIEPGAVALFLAGLTALGFARIRNKRESRFISMPMAGPKPGRFLTRHFARCNVRAETRRPVRPASRLRR